MLEYAVYSVITPEGCASILWKNQTRVEDAARAMKMTAADLVELGIADRVVQEPAGGAHRDHDAAAEAVADAVARELTVVSAQSTAARLEARYEKFRRMGSFAEAQRTS
jgi:acetyl-CoA carboxylase carboxyl transferase subunit alpha